MEENEGPVGKNVRKITKRRKKKRKKVTWKRMKKWLEEKREQMEKK